MELTPDRLASQLTGEPLRPVYLVAGSEPLLVLEAADAVRAAARAQGIGEREVHEMDSRDPDWEGLEASLQAQLVVRRSHPVGHARPLAQQRLVRDLHRRLARHRVAVEQQQPRPVERREHGTDPRGARR